MLLEDYRDLRGRYSKLVSLEMIEAVGWQYFDVFFRRCSELLEPDGLFFLQAIVIDDRLYETEKAARSFANTLIFPGGCLPSVEVIQRCVARETDMSTVWLEEIGAHYARTLELWRERFIANSDLAGELGYDEPFRRLWTLWLAMSEAGFRERRLRDVQMLFAKPRRSTRVSGGRMAEGDGKTVLVTGGSGYLGGWCIIGLLERGYRVRTTVRNPAREREVHAAVESQVGPARSPHGPPGRPDERRALGQRDRGLRLRPPRRLALPAEAAEGPRRADRPRARGNAAGAAAPRSTPASSASSSPPRSPRSGSPREPTPRR